MYTMQNANYVLKKYSQKSHFLDQDTTLIMSSLVPIQKMNFITRNHNMLNEDLLSYFVIAYDNMYYNIISEYNIISIYQPRLLKRL